MVTCGLYLIYRSDPVKVGNNTIYFRGIRIINYAIEALLQLGVNRADQVILTGCSGKMLHTVAIVDSCACMCKLVLLYYIYTSYIATLLF